MCHNDGDSLFFSPESMNSAHVLEKRSRLRLAMPAALAVAVPGIPFLLLGWWLEPWLVGQIERLQQSPAAFSAAVVGLLAADLLLPVPSSLLGTAAGQVLGFVPAALSVWGGLMAGSLVGWFLARRWGRRWAVRFCDPSQLSRVDAWHRRYGLWMLIITRPVPLVAEAYVVLLGLHAYQLRRMLVGLAIANGALAAAYAGLGAISAGNRWSGIALVLSVLVPLALAALVKGLITTTARHTTAARIVPGG